MNAQLAPVMDDTGIEAYTATEQGLAELRALGAALERDL